MDHKKDSQNETIIVEIIAWLFFLGVAYMFIKGIL